MAMMTTTRWWWVRHAPVTVNQGRVYGQTDLPCDTTDAERFQWLARILPPGALLVTSSLQRTTQTADAIAAAGLTLPPPIVEDDLKEQSFGDWQGMTYEEFGQTKDMTGPGFWLAPAYERAPNGESFTDLIARTVPVVTRLSAEHPDRDIVCASHGGTIRAALAMALDLGPEVALRFSIANLSVTRIDCLQTEEGRHWRVAWVNREPNTEHG